MSKRIRLLIIFVILGIAGYFLSPTVYWYWFLDQKTKDISASSMTQLRDYSSRKAFDGIKELRKLLSEPYTAQNIKDKASFAGNLQEAKKPIYQFLKDRLGEQTKSLVATYRLKEEPSGDLVNNLVTDLNRIISGPVFFDPIIFKDVPLVASVKSLADAQYTKTDISDSRYLAVNKIILEDSFIEIGGTDLPDQYRFLSKKINDFFRSVKKRSPDRYTITSVFQSFTRESGLLETMEDHYRAEIVKIKDMRRGIIQLGLDLVGGMRVTIKADFESLAKDLNEDASAIDKKEKMKSVLEILNNRIDKFGVTEPQIRQQGDDRIIVELPGLADPERIRKVILGKGRLNFHIVDDTVSEAARTFINANPADYLSIDGKTLKDATIIPNGRVLLEVVEKDKYGLDQRVGYSVVDEKPALAGEYVQSAGVQYDPQTYTKPIVTFNLSVEGGEIFYKVTQENVKKKLAVVLDDKVKFEATIDEAIRDRVQVRGQGIGYEEASDLALLLRTGALPVPLEIIAQESVGASLGEDAIRQGLIAGVLGIALVALYMFIYYKGGGINANLALLLNIPLIAAVLAVFNFTLTMPGIAAFVLNIGMAVDANVIIFERIKEEFRAGKSRKAAINSGFDKAFRTILDSNLTTIFAAIALAYFGKGPIQGFAIVLTTGIACSMFTAVFVSRLLYDFITDTFNPESISLSWRRIAG